MNLLGYLNKKKLKEIQECAMKLAQVWIVTHKNLDSRNN